MRTEAEKQEEVVCVCVWKAGLIGDSWTLRTEKGPEQKRNTKVSAGAKQEES